MRTTIHNKIRFTSLVSTLLLIISMISTGKLEAQTNAHPMHMPSTAATKTVDIVRDPTDVPPPIGNRPPAVVHVTLTAKEVVGELDSSSGTTYRYWTFNGKVPGPMIRVRQGDTVEVTINNDPSSHMVHSVDFHAALGPGGGAAFSQAAPGKSKTFRFQATTPGLFVYHCGTPMIAEHIANGMYGMILVEPAAGLPHVDHEFYIMQGEIYTTAPKGKTGLQQFSGAKLMQEDPEYFVFNGAVDALSNHGSLHAKVDDTVRIFFGDAGPNETSSLHMVGEIFTRDYALGSLMSPPLEGIQTASVPPGGAAILELSVSMPGQFTIMDHAMARMAKGLMATLDVTGTPTAVSMQEGPSITSSDASTSAVLTGMTKVDLAEASSDIPVAAADAAPKDGRNTDLMSGMSMAHPNERSMRRPVTSRSTTPPKSTPENLNGCMTLLDDGRVMLKLLDSQKVYRLEAQPFLFSANANRLVHVTGRTGSVVETEDPNIPSFVVNTVDELSPNCSTKMSAGAIRKVLLKRAAAAKETVTMSDMGFRPAALVVNAGDKVTWKNTSGVTHNVVDDSRKALYKVDVKLPSGAGPFDSGYLQPDQAFSRVFTVPGIYHYVCTLHEASGMKGTIIVRPPVTMLASGQKSQSGQVGN